MPVLEKYLGKVYLWRYLPNLPAAITFAILFALVSILLGWRVLQARLWFCLPFFAGGIFEVIGHIARGFANSHSGDMGPFIVQAVFLLLPPVLFAATLYMEYARVVRSLQGDRSSIITPRWTTRIFLLGDLLCLNIQSGGAGLTPRPNLVKIKNAIILAGLGLQVLMFIVFLGCCIAFQIRFRTHTRRSRHPSDLPWQSSFWMIYATSLLIQVRNIFRVVEYAMGSEGYLFGHEWPTYTFDAALMLAAIVILFARRPRQFRMVSDDMVELADNVMIAAPPDTVPARGLAIS